MKRLACTLVLALIATPALAANPWKLSLAKDEAILSPADGSGEDAATSLHCIPKSGVVSVTVFIERRIADHLMGDQWVDKAGRRAPWRLTLTATSGALTASFPAAAQADEMNGGSEVQARIPVGEPVMAAFAKTGVIRFSAYGETVKDPAVPKAKAAALVMACTK